MTKKLHAIPNLPPPDPIETPDGLEAAGAGQALWAEVQRQYRIDDIGGYETLRQICCAVDMIARLRQRIDADGAIIEGPNGMREHPGLKMELQYRSFVVRGLARLGLSIEPLRSGPGRPPGYA